MYKTRIVAIDSRDLEQTQCTVDLKHELNMTEILERFVKVCSMEHKDVSWTYNGLQGNGSVYYGTLLVTDVMGDYFINLFVYP